jgi:exonuclease III
MSLMHGHRALVGDSRRTTQSPTNSEVLGEESTSHRSIQTLLQRAQAKWRQLMTRKVPGLTECLGQRDTTLNTKNSRENTYWGDERQPKPHNTTRIYIINLNGLQLDAKGGKFDSVCQSIKEAQADIFCGQEHNVDTTQASVRKILFDTASQHWERNRLAIGTSPIPFKTTFKPGGTMVMAVGSITGRVIKQERDKWGRWTSQIFQGQGGRSLAVISVYQPVAKSGKVGRITVTAQQESLLLQSNDTVHNPRVAFRRDLSTWIADYRTKDIDILVVGDFNEPLGAEPEGISQIASEYQLMDVMSSRHSSAHPATYARGTQRLDYALASEHVCNALQRAGYDPFNSGIATDHRGYYLDLHTETLFGSETQQLADRKRRELSSRNRKQVTAYIRRKYELLINCNAFERAARLHIPGERHAYAERLDKDVVDASLTAEKDLPKIFEPAWSVALAQARKKKLILTKQMSALKTGWDNTEVISYDMEQLDEPFEVPVTIQSCSVAMRQIDVEIKELVATSMERRDDELKRKLQELENSLHTADHKTANEIRKLKKAEDIKNLFRKLGQVRKTQDRRGVTRIEIPKLEDDNPKTCTEWVQIDVPTEVLHHLQQRNRKHFGQAFGTPFTIAPLATDLGFGGGTAQGQQILDGTYDALSLADSVQRLISHMKKVDEIHNDPICPTLTAEEYEGKIRVWTESTTTSPSGLHLGHLKSLIAKHSYSTDATDDELDEDFQRQRDELDFQQRELFNLHLTLLNYALQRGYSYHRWQTVANTILFKDPDNVRIHRTRVIHIYEADYNLVLGVKWREAMYKAEDTSSLNDGQYGSRAKRCAPDPVLIEELQCEISRATRKPMILVNYDAMACYDRIPQCAGMLISRKFGVPEEVTRLNATTLQKAEFRIKTELGLASTGYNHEESAPIYGTGQGSANSPAIWCMLSSALLDGYDEVAAPATYASADNATTVSLGMISFVDDCNGQTNLFESDGSEATVQRLFEHTKTNAQAWSDLLSASGGALEPSKCSSHVMQWEFTAQGVPTLIPMHEDHINALTVRDSHTGEEHRIQLMSTYQAHKTLGHYKAPIGNQTEQFRQLKKKSDDNTAFLWTCPLTHLEAWTYYFACYLPSVGYPLACSALTKNQLDNIQRKAMSIIVARCGYNRNTKKEILYGPLALGGANFRHLYVQQGIGQVATFIRHWRMRSTAGKLLRIAVSWFQQQTGVSYSILETVNTCLPHLESKWIGSLREFLATTGMHLKLDQSSVPKLQRRYDHHIMDAILASRAFTEPEICRLNYCRLYLKAMTVADIVTIDGKQIDQTKWKGDPSLLSSRTHGNSIYQAKPSERVWQLWRRMCKLLWSDNKGQLKESLGPWLLPIHHQRQQHQAYYEHDQLCRSDTILWVRLNDEDEYTRCITTMSPHVFRETTQSRTWQDLPSHATPSVVELVRPELWNLIYHSKMDAPNGNPPVVATFAQYVSQLPAWEAELLETIELAEDPFTVSDALSHGIRAVSDGSVWSDNQGAYGWIISNDRGERVARGMGPARGATVDSYRAEAYGMLTILCFLRRLAEFTTNMEPWKGILATDSKSLLDTITVKPPKWANAAPFAKRKSLRDLDVKCPEWDLVSSILNEMHTLPNLTLQHVKGHQDRTTAYERLSLLAQLNVDADMMAAQYQCEHGLSRPEVLLTDTAGVHLVTPKGYMTKNYEAAMRYQATHPGLSKHIQERYQWSDRVMQNVNWSAHGSSLRKQLKRKTHYTKLVHGILPTCKNVYRRDFVRNKCPLCRDTVEDWEHILKCKHPSRQEWRRGFLTQLETKCKSVKTRPQLERILCDAITGWFNHSMEAYAYELNPSAYPKEVRRLIRQQNAIGWQQLFLGRFSGEWSALQDNYYAQKRAEAVEMDQTKKKTKKQTGQRWQISIIGILWEQWWALWESRNKDLHGEDARSRAAAETREVHRKLRELYDIRAQLSDAVQALMYEEVTDHYDRPNWFNKNWIAIHEPLIHADRKRVATRIKAGVRSIRQFLISLATS